MIGVEICRSKFTEKASTRELCPSPLRTVSISIANNDGTETRSILLACPNKLKLNWKHYESSICMKNTGLIHNNLFNLQPSS